MTFFMSPAPHKNVFILYITNVTLRITRHRTPIVCIGLSLLVIDTCPAILEFNNSQISDLLLIIEKKTTEDYVFIKEIFFVFSCFSDIFFFLKAKF